ncbi:MAG TPA: AraC family transcriptional regulator [Gemmatimonadaceae bacterium]|jgi:AraC family transcriptional activator of mtrCDE
MTGPSIAGLAAHDLDRLLSALEVSFVRLSECVVSPGYGLELGGVDAPGIHYNLRGTGTLYMGDHPPISLSPHTLIVVPRNSPFRVEARDPKSIAAPIIVDHRSQTLPLGSLRRFAVGDGEPGIVLICGYFNASYGSSTDLFASLTGPIAEQFEPDDKLDQKLKAALDELTAQEVGAATMSASLLKQVIVALLRRSLTSKALWTERFAMLSDARIARSFAAMAAYPGKAHTVESLASVACLSRSAFMARFGELVGRPPMIVLRELRMRQAAQQLTHDDVSVEQVARAAGYASHSSFVRAFHRAYGVDPSEYRAAAPGLGVS